MGGGGERESLCVTLRLLVISVSERVYEVHWRESIRQLYTEV